MTTHTQHSVIGQVVDAVERVLADASRPVPLHVPNLGGSCGKYVSECVETGWVSSAGAFVDRFEQDIAAYTGAKRAVAVVNGTAALHIALLMAGVKPGDEVLCPSLTFVATANSITYANAIPHFVDAESTTLGIDSPKNEEYLDTIAEHRGGSLVNKATGRRIAALVGMHAFGHPFDLPAAQRLCQRFDIPLIEDAAESLGSFVGDRHTGTFGEVGILSFNGNKIVTTGGGGVILTNDEQQADWAKHITTTAKQPHKWAYEHDEIGFNYRMPNLNAALGCGQLEELDSMLARKRALADRYLAAFEGLDGARIILEPDGTTSNYWFVTMILDETNASRRDDVMGALHDSGFLVRPIWNPMHTLPMYRDCPRMDMTMTESLASRVINLPSSAHL